MAISLEKSVRRVGLLVSAAAAVSLALAGCASPAAPAATGARISIDVGGGKTIDVQGPPQIAYFTSGTTVPYLQARQKGVEAAAAAIPGASVASFDPRNDPQTQISQIRSAITSKKYNAFIVDATSGDLLCNILTKDAPAANIAVVSVAGPICGLNLQPSSKDHWAPGTVAIIDNQSIDYFADYLGYVVKQNPGPQNVIVLQGPPLHPRTALINAALDRVKTQYPDFNVVAQGETDFSALKGQQQAQSLLAAHPETTLIFTAFSDITQGAVTAVQQAGKSGQVKLYDVGGSRPILELIKSGAVASTTAGYPVSAGKAAVAALKAAVAGEPGPRVILNDGGPVPDGSTTGLVVLDKTNVGDFVAEE